MMKHLWKTDQIPPGSLLYRQTRKDQLDRQNKFIPSDTNFKLGKGEDGLSVDWKKHTNPDSILERIGKTYKYGTTEVKNPELYDIFPLAVDYVRSLDGIKSVEHNPIYNEPEQEGNPNNRAHTLIIYNEVYKHIKDTKIRIKLRDHAVEMAGQ